MQIRHQIRTFQESDMKYNKFVKNVQIQPEPMLQSCRERPNST